MPKQQRVYKIVFISQDEVYEVYAKSFVESDVFGFIEVQEFVFGEKSSLVVDPSQERLKLEFSGVKRSYIPMHSIIRIDEVDKEGVGKVSDAKGHSHTNVSQFPGTAFVREEKE